MCLPDNQQVGEEKSRLPTVFARSSDYPSGKFVPKRKNDITDVEKANKRSGRVGLKEKWRIPSVNLRSIQLVFSSVRSTDQALLPLDQAHSAHWRFLEKIRSTYKKEDKGAKNHLK